MKKIKYLLLPTVVISNMPLVLASCGHNYKNDYSQEVQNVIEKFIEITKIPRCTSDGVKAYLNGIRNYIAKEATNIGLPFGSVNTDNYGNLWFDVPATTGCENYQPLILQCHMDMVVAGLDKEAKATTPINAEVDWKKGIIHTKDYKTSLGADDGIGIAIILTLLQDKNIQHGPIRVLASADEDSGMLGALALYQEKDQLPVLSKMGKDFSGQDIKYLLNLDNEVVGDLDKSCAGSITYSWSKDYSPAEEAKLSNSLYIDLNGLKGGHSGTDTKQHRANAEKCLYEILYEITSHSNNVQIVKNYHPKDDKDISFERNQIVPHARVVFNTDVDASTIQGYINTKKTSWATTYTGEDWSKVNITVGNNSGIDHSKFIAKANSANIIAMIGQNTIPSSTQTEKSLWFGCVEPQPSETEYGNRYKYSANIAPLEISLTNENKIHFLVSSQTRMIDVDNTMPNYNLMDSYYNGTNKLKIDDIEPVVNSWYKPWIDNGNNKIIKLVSDAYTSVGVKPNIVDDLAGVEPSWWKQCNPNLNLTCVGPTIYDAHSVKETLDINTIKPIIDVCKQIFKKMA